MDLELAGAIVHLDVLQQEVNCAGRTIIPLMDNTPTLSWQHKGSTLTTGPAAYLLHVASLHQWHYQYLAKPNFIKGSVNDMADDCSHLFQRARTKDGHWRVWEMFIATFKGVNPYLTELLPPIKLHFLQVFTTCLQQGLIAPSSHPIWSWQVEDYVRTIGEEIASVDTDPRLTASGALHNKIAKLQHSYKKQDPPPDRVKPIPIPLLCHMAESHQTSEFDKAVVDLGTIGFYYMLRPGEYTYSRENNHPFRMTDVSFQAGLATVNATLITTQQLDASTKAHMEFTDQKNGEKGEAITHGDNPEPIISPFKVLCCCIEHLRQHRAPPSTPLYTIYTPTGMQCITSWHITAALHNSCKHIGHELGIAAKDISARTICAGSAMALLHANIDSTLIRLQGWWKSWAMLEYLHRSTADTSHFAAAMVPGGTYVISRHSILPDDIASFATAPL